MEKALERMCGCDRVKCTCLTRAPAAVVVLMAFGCAPCDDLPAAGKPHRALHRISDTNESSFKTLECVHVDADVNRAVSTPPLPGGVR